MSGLIGSKIIVHVDPIDRIFLPKALQFGSVADYWSC